jgi:ATP-dependent Clp protease ATP-binding subunit ClpC
LQAAVTEAISLDHNYIGCEHLLLGLVAETDGIAGRALRAQGAEHKTVRRAVVAALAGYVHLRAQTSTTPAAAEGLVADAVRRELAPITERLTALERHVGVGRA